MPRIAGINSGEAPVGAVEAFGGIVAPKGWLFCNGASLLRANYPELFGVLSTSFGAPNANEFFLPDFRGKFLRMVAGGQATDPDRGSRSAPRVGAAIPGSAGDQVGSVQADQFRIHQHYIGTSGADANNPSRGPFAYPGTESATTAEGGSETRPINAYVNYIIKYA